MVHLDSRLSIVTSGSISVPTTRSRTAGLDEDRDRSELLCLVTSGSIPIPTTCPRTAGPDENRDRLEPNLCLKPDWDLLGSWLSMDSMGTRRLLRSSVRRLRRRSSRRSAFCPGTILFSPLRIATSLGDRRPVPELFEGVEA